jgi:hypothetical protein
VIYEEVVEVNVEMAKEIPYQTVIVTTGPVIAMIYGTVIAMNE